MTPFEKCSELAGRVLIAALFLITGFDKIPGYAGTQAYMQSQGVPGALLPLVIALELLGAMAIIVGYRTRLVAAALAVFSLAAGVLFHGGDPAQKVMLLKNLAIAGGFLFLVARGAGDWSVDARTAARAAPGELLRRP